MRSMQHLYIIMTLLLTVYGQLVFKWQIDKAGQFPQGFHQITAYLLKLLIQPWLISYYPFTTLTPGLGVVKTQWQDPFIVADIPGLIKGAHEGAGLGIQFLKHIERTRILIHLIDASQINTVSPLDAYNTVCNELAMFDKKLMDKPQLVVLNKIDLPSALDGTVMFEKMFNDKDVLCVSALSKQGLDKLISKLLHMLENFHDV